MKHHVTPTACMYIYMNTHACTYIYTYGHTRMQEFITLWGGLQPGDSQRFSLVWESAELIKLSTEMRDMLASIAGQQAARWAATTFVASATVALSALFLPTLVVSAFGSVDGIWAIVLDRAQKSGVLLAHVLMSCCHGGRPVTLVGYSMGARLVYYCLQELAAYNAMGATDVHSWCTTAAYCVQLLSYVCIVIP